MVKEVFVYLKAIGRVANVYPVGKLGQRKLAPLEEDNVRHYVGSRIGAESVVWQTYGTQQFAALCKVTPDRFVPGIHRVAARDERNDAARTHLVEHFGGKVVVNGKTETVVLRVKHLVVAKWDVADSEVEEAGAIGRLKARDGNLCLRVKLLGYASGD